MKARKEAQQADVVVVNHHLFFADVALKDSGMAELLPSANTIIFDEAHQLPEPPPCSSATTVSTSQVLELCRDVLAEGLAHARDGADWAKVVTVVEKAARDLRLTFPEDIGTPVAAADRPSRTSSRRWQTLKDELDGMLDVLEAGRARRDAGAVPRARGRTGASKPGSGALEIRPEGARVAKGEEAVLWVEAFASSLQLHKTPLSIAPILPASAKARRAAGSSPRPRWR
jgi:ATP-dependent DNA helicase DinG